jgi:hypothetical protein
MRTRRPGDIRLRRPTEKGTALGGSRALLGPRRIVLRAPLPRKARRSLARSGGARPVSERAATDRGARDQGWDEPLRMTAEGALAAAPARLALHAAIVVDARLVGAEQLAIAGLELVQSQLGDGAWGRDWSAVPERLAEMRTARADARRERARHDSTCPPRARLPRAPGTPARPSDPACPGLTRPLIIRWRLTQARMPQPPLTQLRTIGRRRPRRQGAPSPPRVTARRGARASNDAAHPPRRA